MAAVVGLSIVVVVVIAGLWISQSKAAIERKHRELLLAQIDMMPGVEFE